jgi:hypothetical protein
MKAFAATLGVGFALVLLTGCGSSSTQSWQVVNKIQVAKDKPAYMLARVGRPADVELKVDSKPGITTHTSYTVLCGDDLSNEDNIRDRTSASGPTPLTAPINLPPGSPGPCVLNLTASKSAPAAMTLTLLMRPPATN